LCESNITFGINFQVENLATIGGDNVAQCVRRTLKCVMTNSLCLKFNWKGKGEKRGFSSSELLPVIKSKYIIPKCLLICVCLL